MSSAQILIEKKAVLEKALAGTLKQAHAQRRELEAQIERERHAEIQAGVREVRKIVPIHNLTQKELLSVLDSPAARKAQAKDGKGGLLSEMRHLHKFL